MRLLTLIAALGMAVLCGCTTASEDACRNVENSKKLRVGMTKHQVLEIMGEPLKEEIFCQPDLWYYYIRTVWMDGMITEDECMPLAFENGKLAGWGNAYISRNKLEKREAAQDLEVAQDGSIQAKDDGKTQKQIR